jgi:hypothetical protein
MITENHITEKVVLLLITHYLLRVIPLAFNSRLKGDSFLWNYLKIYIHHQVTFHPYCVSYSAKFQEMFLRGQE